MLAKHKIIIANFDENKSEALNEWLNQIGGFSVINADLDKIEDQSLNADIMIIYVGYDKKYPNLEKANFPIISVGKNLGFEVVNFPLPLRLANLEASLRMQLQAKINAEISSIIIDGQELNPLRRSLLDKNGIEVKLTEKEVDILHYLHLARGNPISRETLLKEVWHYSEGVTTHTLETHIYRLRQKLAQIIGQREILITEENGYILRLN